MKIEIKNKDVINYIHKIKVEGKFSTNNKTVEELLKNMQPNFDSLKDSFDRMKKEKDKKIEDLTKQIQSTKDDSFMSFFIPICIIFGLALLLILSLI